MKINNLKSITLLFVFLINTLFALAQTITIKGVVKDKLGPLTGVTVRVDESNTGTITNLNGEYSISATAKSTLKFSFMGYETLSEKVNGRQTVNVILSDNLVNLEELVVVGYGTQKKRDITGSIVSVSAEDIQKNTPTSIGDALQGKVAGLSILSSSEPGQTSQFKIRGISTLGDEAGSNPLFIVDGMEVASIDNLNPKDIASVEVLKDAASTAIYGSMSANGVILITTKQGEKSKPLFNISYSTKLAEIAKKMPQMNRNEANNYDAIRSYLEGTSSLYVVTDTLSPIYQSEYYYQDLLFRNSLSHQVDMSVSGAENKIKYFTSAGFLSDNGIYINTYNRRLNARINVEYQANPKLTIGTRISPSVSDIRKAPFGTRKIILQRPSYITMYHPVTGDYMPYMSGVSNPLALSELGKNNSKDYAIDFNEYFNYKFSNSLMLRVSLSANAKFSNQVTAVPADQRFDNLSTASNQNYTSTLWNHESTLTYKENFNKKHNVNGLIGYSFRESQYEGVRQSGSGMPASMQLMNSYELINVNSTYSSWTQSRMVSAFTRFGYDFKGRYLINSNIRLDGSSRFGSNNRWGLFPSLSTGWRISDEKFMKWTKPFLTDAKLRASYGVTGNQTAGDFASMRLYKAIYYANSAGLIPSQLENEDLGWETTKQLNAGIDLLMANGKINIIFDLYNKYTTDVLYGVRLPQTSGFSTTYKNIGDVRNFGIETSIQTVNIRKKNIEWKTTFNFSTNKNQIVSIPPGGEQLINDIYYMAKGYEVGTMYGYKALSIFAYDESNAFTADWQQLTPVYNGNGVFQDKYLLNGQTTSITPAEVSRLRFDTPSGQVFKGGDVYWHDKDKNGIIDAKDRQILGKGMPTITGGVGSDLKYKAFSLSLFFNYSFGNDVYNFANQDINSHLWSPKMKVDPVVMQNSWLAPGDVKMYPKPAKSTVGNTRINSSLWVEDGSFIRLTNLKLSYECPKSVYSKLNLKGLIVSLQANNLLTWTNYSGFDPEVLSSSFTAGYDNNSYPKARTYMVSLNINL